LSGYTSTANDYLPKSYTSPQLPVASLGQLGGIKPRRGMTIDTVTGDTDILPVSSDLITSMNTNHFTNNTQTGKIDIHTDLAELKGKGWTDALYNSTTGKVTFDSNDALGFTTGDIRGGKGDKGDTGKGWTGVTYDTATGKVTFASNDVLGYTTGDIRGGKGDKGDKGYGWTDASYNSTTGVVTFNSADGLGFTTGSLKGTNGTCTGNIP